MPATLTRPDRIRHSDSKRQTRRTPHHQWRKDSHAHVRARPTLDPGSRPARPRVKPRARRRPNALKRFLQDFAPEHAFTVYSFVIASGVFLLCALDLTVAWPWLQASRLFDVGFLLCGIAMLGLTYDVFKDQSHLPRPQL